MIPRMLFLHDAASAVQSLLSYVLLAGLFLFVAQRLRVRIWQRQHTVAFFHPQCSGMGGGERVLWCAVNEVLVHSDVAIYTTTTNAARRDEILARVQKGFGISVPQDRHTTLQFVPVRLFALTDNPRLFPVFTLLLQNLCSLLVAAEACLRYPCGVFVESTGFPFTLPVAKVFGSRKVLTYIHYPTMSYDMIARVQNSVQMYNNQNYVAKSKLLTSVKLVYYHTFLFLYGASGFFADHVWCNSSWTRARILRIFAFTRASRIELLYPPTDLDSLVAEEDRELLVTMSSGARAGGKARSRVPSRAGSSSSRSASRVNRVISLAQFRIEKDHALQVEAFAEAAAKNAIPPDATLEMCGSTRGAEDEQLADGLQARIDELQLSERVKINRNLPFPEIVEKLRSSKVALHTMRDEHFGITLAEFVAARLLCVCHRSGGPKEDILCATDLQKELLAETQEEFAEALQTAFERYDKAGDDLDAAIAWLAKFPTNKDFGERIAREVAGQVESKTE